MSGCVRKKVAGRAARWLSWQPSGRGAADAAEVGRTLQPRGQPQTAPQEPTAASHVAAAAPTGGKSVSSVSCRRRQMPGGSGASGRRQVGQVRFPWSTIQRWQQCWQKSWPQAATTGYCKGSGPWAGRLQGRCEAAGARCGAWVGRWRGDQPWNADASPSLPSCAPQPWCTQAHRASHQKQVHADGATVIFLAELGAAHILLAALGSGSPRRSVRCGTSVAAAAWGGWRHPGCCRPGWRV